MLNGNLGQMDCMVNVPEFSFELRQIRDGEVALQTIFYCPETTYMERNR